MPHFGKRGDRPVVRGSQDTREGGDDVSIVAPWWFSGLYTRRVIRLSHFSVATIMAVCIITGHTVGASAAGPSLTTSEGRPVVWADWLEENGPVAVLLWASWVPDAATTLDNIETITAAARKRDLEVILVAVQEALGDAQASLDGVDIQWFHDRYGDLLKENRVVSIPRLLVISGDGTVVERLDVTPESIRAWGGG